MADLFDIAVAKKLSGGGGGSSDFSTASVTVIGNHYVQGSFIATLPSGLPTDYATFPSNALGNQLILYRGFALITTHDNVTSISGNIEDIGDGAYLVTGDCTITIS